MNDKLTTQLIIFIIIIGCILFWSNTTIYNNATIQTIKYKEHQYIFYNAYQKGSICHDPDCPCLKK